MKVDRLKLQKALEIVKPGLGAHTDLQLADSFAFIDGRVLTYNDEVSVSHPVEEIDFEGAISAEELYGFLSKLDKDNVDIQLKDTELLVKCGRSRAGLKLEDLTAGGDRGIMYVMEDQKLLDDKKWKAIPNPEIFCRYLLFATQACSRDMTERVLNCVHVMSEGMIQSTDTMRIIECKIPAMKIKNFLIPASSVLEVVKIQPTEISVNGGWAHFRNEEGTVVAARLVDGKFYSQDVIFSIIDFVGTNVQFPKRADAMLSRTHQFAKRDFVFDESVKIDIKDGLFTMYATAQKTKSWVKETARVRSKKSLSFWVSPSFFAEVLKDTKICKVSKDGTRAKFEEINGDWVYVITLGKGEG